jgi:hypothetical protein
MQLYKIISSLRKISKDEITVQKYTRQVLVLSNLRNLTSTFHKTVENNMPLTLTFNIENDIFYMKGIKKGIEKDKKEITINLIGKGFDNDFISLVDWIKLLKYGEELKNIQNLDIVTQTPPYLDAIIKNEQDLILFERLRRLGR